MRRFFFSLLTLLLLSIHLTPESAFTQTDERCFAETNFCISNEIGADWNKNGNLPVFGFPITESRQEINRENSNYYLTQWFERNRFELHFVETAADGRGRYLVLLGRLGDDRLRQQGRDWRTFPKAAPKTPHYFAATGHAIAPQFINYWR